MRRRTFLSATATALGASVTGATLSGVGVRQALAAPDTIQPLMFDSTASLLDASGNPLTDDALVAVWAEGTAYNADEDGDGDAVPYPTGTDIPLVASDGGVVGFGAPIGQDDTDFTYGNEEFLLNVLDAEAGGGTILFDEGHGQFYDADTFSAVLDYAADNGYSYQTTTDVESDLGGASVLVVTSPSDAFSASELSAVGSFVDGGGTLLLFSQSDFSNYDETDNINEVAAAAGAGFRFNDDQVYDDDNNVGPPYIPTTARFNTAFDYFDERDGLGFEVDPGQTYVVDLVEVIDGDTVKVEFDGGYVENLRLLGIDTPETPGNAQFERTEEWEGIESLDYLGAAGDDATAYAQDLLDVDTVEVEFDGNEPVRDAFGRMLTYVYFDDGGDRTLYNRRAIADGHARVYDSSLEKHDEFLATELGARGDGTGLWAESDPGSSATIRNDPVDELFFPDAAPVVTMDGPIDPNRVPVFAAPTAQQEGSSVVYDGDVPLVGLDQHARVAMLGAPIIDESYEQAEDYPVDTSGFGNFVFLTHVVDRLSRQWGWGGHGDVDLVLIDGGHGQFGVDYALSAEDAAYYQRYLEGVDVGFEGVNDVTGPVGASLLAAADAYVVTSPVSSFSDDELDALQLFAAHGGAVVLMGGDAPPEARTNLNAVADALCSDLRIGDGRVVDPDSNLNGDPAVPVTSNLDTWYRLFDAYTGDTHYKGPRGPPGRPGCHTGHGRPGKGHGRGRGTGSKNGNGRGNGNGKRQHATGRGVGTLAAGW